MVTLNDYKVPNGKADKLCRIMDECGIPCTCDGADGDVSKRAQRRKGPIEPDGIEDPIEIDR